MSMFSGKSVEKEVKQILNIPEYMKIAYAVRLGYPTSAPAKHLRVRRNIENFTYHNRFGSKLIWRENKGGGERSLGEYIEHLIRGKLAKIALKKFGW